MEIKRYPVLKLTWWYAHSAVLFHAPVITWWLAAMTTSLPSGTDRIAPCTTKLKTDMRIGSWRRTSPQTRCGLPLRQRSVLLCFQQYHNRGLSSPCGRALSGMIIDWHGGGGGGGGGIGGPCWLGMYPAQLYGGQHIINNDHHFILLALVTSSIICKINTPGLIPRSWRTWDIPHRTVKYKMFALSVIQTKSSECTWLCFFVSILSASGLPCSCLVGCLSTKGDVPRPEENART